MGFNRVFFNLYCACSIKKKHTWDLNEYGLGANMTILGVVEIVSQDRQIKVAFVFCS